MNGLIFVFLICILTVCHTKKMANGGSMTMDIQSASEEVCTIYKLNYSEFHELTGVQLV